MLCGFLPCWGSALGSCHLVKTVCCPCLRHLRGRTCTHGITGAGDLWVVTGGDSGGMPPMTSRGKRLLKRSCQILHLWGPPATLKTFTGTVGSLAQLSDGCRGLPTASAPVSWATGSRQHSGERAGCPRQKELLLCPSQGEHLHTQLSNTLQRSSDLGLEILAAAQIRHPGTSSNPRKLWASTHAETMCVINSPWP